MIRFNNVFKKYNDICVLSNINLNIDKGDIYGIIGTSGAGKSTLLKLINGLENYDSGELDVLSQNVKEVTDLRQFRRKIGMIFQNFALLERKNVFENIAFPLKCAKKSKEEINHKVDLLLKKVGIFDKKYAMPNQLSGGQRQRVAIARALALNPDILLCDEATSGLDPKTTITILELLKELNISDEITIVIVTHEMDVIEKICDKVAIIENGKVVSDGLVEDVLNEYDIQEEYDFNRNNIYLKINYNNLENKDLLFDLATTTGVFYEIEDCHIQKLKDRKISTFIIKIDVSDLEKVEKYFTEKQISFKVLEVVNNDR